MGLKRAVRNSACGLLATALVWLGYARKAKKRAFQQDVITSIAFHNPDRKLFERIVVWLKKNGYVFLSSGQMIEVLNRRITCPRGAAWISLDDGWKENMENVIPVARQHGIPVTIFICTDAVEQGSFWWRIVRQSPDLFPVGFRDDKKIRELPENERRRIIDSIDRSGLDFKREAMDVNDIRSISAIPEVTIGAHTVSHAVLPKCTDEQLEYELSESKRKLEGWVGKPVTVFAYPNGSFDGRERRFLEAHGYELAGTVESEFVRPDSDRYLVPRNIIMDDGSFAENLCHALGIWDPLVKRFKRVVGKRTSSPHQNGNKSHSHDYSHSQDPGDRLSIYNKAN